MSKFKAGYICQKCGMDVSDVPVRERAEGEDIIKYAHYVARVCGDNHYIRSPMCNSKVLDVKPIIVKGDKIISREELSEEEKDAVRKKFNEGE